jgi:magnesium-transporting ATPase (P-type)
VLPVQLLWVNLATAILLGTSLIFEPREPGLMDLPPRSPSAPILDRSLLIRTLLVSLVLGLAAFGFFTLARRLGLSAEQGRTLAINTIVVVEVGYLFACRSLRLPAWRLGFWSNRWMWLGVLAMLLAQLAFTYLPVMNRLFHTAPVDAIWWLALSATGFLVYVLAEVKKLLTAPSAPHKTPSPA